MRIRSIKPEFWEDEVMASLHPHARLLFIATWQLADKNGVLEHRPAWIKAKVFPYEDWEAIGKHLGSTREAPGNTNFDGVLRSLIDHGFLVEFTADGRDYLYVRNFKKHQRINGKEAVAKSVNPCPPTDIESEKHPRSTREAPEKHLGAQEQGAGSREQGMVPPLPPVPVEGPPQTPPEEDKKEEEKRREEASIATSNASSIQQAADAQLSLAPLVSGNGSKPKRSRQPKEPVQIPDSLNTPEFLEWWEKWNTHLRQKKSPATPLASEGQLEELCGLGVETAIVWLKHAIRKNWKSLHEPNTPTNNRGGYQGPDRVKGTANEYFAQVGTDWSQYTYKGSGTDDVSPGDSGDGSSGEQVGG